MEADDWRRHWVVDLDTCTVTHVSGLVVAVSRSPDDDATDYSVSNIDAWQEKMLAVMPLPDVFARARQLLREAVQLYQEEQTRRH